MKLDASSQLLRLAKPFPKWAIKAPPRGKFGNYAEHSFYNQRALTIVGPHSFEVVEIIRGQADEVQGEGKTWPGREDAVVGVRARLTATIDERVVTVIEVGSEDNPAMHNDAESAKNAASDAYKRCWMRLGFGLFLWVKEPREYFLEVQLAAQEGITVEQEVAPVPDGGSAGQDATEDDDEKGDGYEERYR